MRVQDLISKWINEAQKEHDRAKENQNAYKMLEFKVLISELKKIRDKL